jgi:hypothetical protein
MLIAPEYEMLKPLWNQAQHVLPTANIFRIGGVSDSPFSLLPPAMKWGIIATRPACVLTTVVAPKFLGCIKYGIMKDLHGKISVTLKGDKLKELLSKYVAGFDANRFEIVAVRLFSAQELILTVFALDKHNNNTTVHEGRMPVKKFKLEISSPLELPELAEAFNFTVCNEDYRLEEMEVINK